MNILIYFSEVSQRVYDVDDLTFYCSIRHIFIQKPLTTIFIAASGEGPKGHLRIHPANEVIPIGAAAMQ